MSKFQNRVKYKYKNNVFEGTPAIAFYKRFPHDIGNVYGEFVDQ